ncbi:MAG: LysM peptidoglycan-binding domain-containing M23 family metallopeptidase [Pseudolabrys sp.]
MSRSKVLSRSRIWPRAAVLALAGITAASCSDSARFDSNPYASNNRQAPAQETTGSIAPRSSSHQVVSQPLPAVSRPATVASSNGTANGAQGLGAYRPSTQASNDVTGSVRPAPPKPSGEWTWDGGSPVTVGYGESADQIARRHNVPVAALLQTNGITNAAAIKPGQRLVIPRYVTHNAAAPAPVAAVAPAGNVHIVAPGESLIGIARHHHISLTALAKLNNIQPYTKVSIGDRITVPGGARPAPQRQAQLQAAPHVAAPNTVQIDKVGSVPAQSARIATQEPEEKADNAVKTAEAAGGMPSFRWPVKGRVIAGFGPKTNGGQNDGINLAVPEGTAVKAADDGVVAYAGNELKGYGNLVLIRHSNGFVSAYAHASELMVKRGDTIKRGQVIAHAGQTGNVTSPQLHFEIRKGSTPVDPTKYLSGA